MTGMAAAGRLSLRTRSCASTIFWAVIRTFRPFFCYEQDIGPPVPFSPFPFEHFCPFQAIDEPGHRGAVPRQRVRDVGLAHLGVFRHRIQYAVLFWADADTRFRDGARKLEIEGRGGF